MSPAIFEQMIPIDWLLNLRIRGIHMVKPWLGNWAFRATRNLRRTDFIFNSKILQRVTSFIIDLKEERQNERHVTEFHGELNLLCSHKPSWWNGKSVGLRFGQTWLWIPLVLFPRWVIWTHYWTCSELLFVCFSNALGMEISKWGNRSLRNRP